MYTQWKIEHTTETDYFLKIHENNLHNEEMQWEVWRLSQYLFSYEYFYSVALWNVSHPPVSLSLHYSYSSTRYTMYIVIS